MTETLDSEANDSYEFPELYTGEDYLIMTDLRSVFYNHSYATMITAVFLFSLLVTTLYFFGLIPGEPKTQAGLDRLLVITGTLLVTTIVVWIATITMISADV